MKKTSVVLMCNLAETLRDGAEADIFYDAKDYGDTGKQRSIDDTIASMRHAASVLESVASLMDALKDTIAPDGDLKTLDMGRVLDAMNGVDEKLAPGKAVPRMKG